MKPKPGTKPSIVAAPQWRELQKQGKASALSRFVTITRAEASEQVSFTASTATPDRYGDTIDQTGWVTDAYEKNPVLLWAHSYSTPPVGKVGALDKSGDLKATGIEFTPAEMNAFGAQVGEMVRSGFLNTVSVGFLPLEWEQRISQTGELLGYNFKRCELLEISVVPVPANPQALLEGRSFAKSFTEWAEHAETEQPIAAGWQNEARALLKAAGDAVEHVVESKDADAFAEMLTLLKRIAEATEAQKADIEAIAKALVAGSAVVKSADTREAARQPTLTDALHHLLTRR